MAKRHKDALAIQEGACNPIAIINTMKAACEEIRKEEAFHGTASMTEDPALRLMVHQLAFICGIINGVEDFANRHMPNYGDCSLACREAVLVTCPHSVQVAARRYALLSPQGTACPETVLTEAEYTQENRERVESEYVTGAPDDPAAGTWTDVTENEACR